MEHISIMLKETVEGLAPRSDGVYVDGTLGRGGHSSYLLSFIKEGKLYAFDQDRQAIIESDQRLAKISDRYELIHDNFIHIPQQLRSRGIFEVDGMMFDLGVSSPQFDDGERGFSYHYDARLDMRMNQEQALDAYYVVNNYSKEDLIRIFYKYGEESFAKSIAQRIEVHRQQKPIETTLELVDIIKEGIPKKFHAGKHPARKVFQALRIEVNHELDVLEQMLEECLDMLAVGGRMSVITFHSLEDRMVKESFARRTTPPKLPKNVPLLAKDMECNYRLVNRKVIVADEEELEANPRSRSAKLRIIERIK
ncbi:MAG: 16S rRNA (cytosine(1402)-N(4))-methyltransferase RsmH [Erysipelotrichaceae bacterium]|nr:16S rRNA (cytosine(1402)-N(4))-methyltransferase RsmH [Erysipelotrichaceae bacterium]MBR3694236.1 16S rRNA (cytosine(1402)-N(4))-methyltransferase RsmH [Erysipelotrichales bacterium]